MRKSKGFTVMELTVYMGLLAIFLTVLSQLFVASIEVQLESEVTSGIEENGKFLLARFSYDVPRASSVTVPAAPGQTSNSLQLIVGGVTYTYQLTGNNLTLTDNTGTQQLNSTESTISNLVFTRRGSQSGKPVITVSFRVTSIVKGNSPSSKDFQTTIATR